MEKRPFHINFKFESAESFPIFKSMKLPDVKSKAPHPGGDPRRFIRQEGNSTQNGYEKGLTTGFL